MNVRRVACCLIASAAVWLGVSDVATATTTSYFSYVYFNDYDPGHQSNNTSLSYSEVQNGAVNTAFSSLASGQLGVLNAGANTTGFVFSQVLAQFGDTITATGPASGFGALNLGVNLDVNANNVFTDPSVNFAFLWVYGYRPGTFDQSFYNSPGNILFAEGFLLGDGTNPNYAALFAVNDVPLVATYLNGTNNIPLDIPFSTLGTDFELNVVLSSVTLSTSEGRYMEGRYEPHRGRVVDGARRRDALFGVRPPARHVGSGSGAGASHAFAACPRRCRARLHEEAEGELSEALDAHSKPRPRAGAFVVAHPSLAAR